MNQKIEYEEVRYGWDPWDCSIDCGYMGNLGDRKKSQDRRTKGSLGRDCLGTPRNRINRLFCSWKKIGEKLLPFHMAGPVPRARYQLGSVPLEPGLFQA